MTESGDIGLGPGMVMRNLDTTRVTSQSFPGVFTLPQFDPIIAFG